MTLEVIWYLVIILCLIAYAVLDGFDLGVGALHLFTKKDEDRRVFLNAIGPVWDGNEVWLVIVVGAMFAGFPEAYATLFSSFYNLTMGLLMSLIFSGCCDRVSQQTRIKALAGYVGLCLLHCQHRDCLWDRPCARQPHRGNSLGREQRFYRLLLRFF